MRAIVIEPKRKAVVMEIDGSYQGLRELVGGGIEMSFPFDDYSLAVVINECGKLDGLPLNRSVRDANGKILDIYAGTMVIVRLDEDGKYTSVTDGDIRIARELFGKVETQWYRSDF